MIDGVEIPRDQQIGEVSRLVDGLCREFVRGSAFRREQHAVTSGHRNDVADLRIGAVVVGPTIRGKNHAATGITNAAHSPDVQIVEATTINRGFDASSNKHTITVLCGEWQKFGVPVYPEYLKRLGFNSIDDLPLGTTPFNKTVVVQMGKGKTNPDEIVPKRIIGLAN